MSRLSLSLMGGFEAKLENEYITGFTTDKVRALLAYLVMESKRPHHRELLANMFWPGFMESSARASLRHALSNLRRVLADDHADLPFLLIEGETIQLNPASDYYLDVEAFKQLTDALTASTDKTQSTITNLQSAISLYRGSFLEGFSLKDCWDFDAWAEAVRDDLQHRTLAALYRLAEVYEQQGELEKVGECARKQLELELWREEAHQQLMRVLARQGLRSQALAQYESLRQTLKNELGVEPSAETLQIYEQIRDGVFAPSKEKDQFGIVQDVHAKPQHNLPIQLTSFVGRVKEIQEIQALLYKHRLVTLTGAGGCGKTRLCLQTAASLIEHFPDGVWLVELAPVSDPARVALSVGNALGLLESSEQPVQEQLLFFLRKRHTLLLLDNCEHLVVVCAQLCDAILRACPQVSILATSRETLDIAGEIDFYVPSLSIPDLGFPSELEALNQYEAVRLFVERAGATLPGFHLTTENATAVVQVCTHLDGIPLAIELAAARVMLLQVSEIASRLDDRFQLLTGGSRAALPRHQTLRACIEWSYHLLSDAECRLLQWLSVFSGGWTLEAVEAVCGQACAQGEVLDLLEQLASKSLVLVERIQGQKTRYRLLETIRQYGKEKLEEAGEADSARQRHLVYYRQLAEQTGPKLRGPNRAVIQHRLEAELDNLRLALEWSLRDQDDPDWWPEDGLCLASALMWFWHARLRMEEGTCWLERLLALEERRRGAQPLSLNRILGRARALVAASYLYIEGF